MRDETYHEMEALLARASKAMRANLAQTREMSERLGRIADTLAGSEPPAAPALRVIEGGGDA
jgi:hypothetical protein